MATLAVSFETEPRKPTPDLQEEFRRFKALTSAFGSSLGALDIELKPRSLAGQERILNRLRMFNEILSGTVHVLARNPGHAGP